jgi:hypothetical protein
MTNLNVGTDPNIFKDRGQNFSIYFLLVVDIIVGRRDGQMDVIESSNSVGVVGIIDQKDCYITPPSICNL